MSGRPRPAPRGEGVGLRVPHLDAVLRQGVQVPVLEAITENYLVVDGQPYRNLRRIAERIPVILHGVCLGLGGADEPDAGLVARIASLARDIDAPWVSDHLAWTRHGRHHLHDLLPVPLTEDVLAALCERVRRVQDQIGRPFALENPSTYLAFARRQMPEAEFLGRLAEATGCHLLVDVNNIVVSCANQGTSVADYLDAVPWSRVIQLHVAGHTTAPDGFKLDTHDQPVSDAVWSVYDEAQRRSGGVVAILERDADIPDLDELLSTWRRGKACA